MRRVMASAVMVAIAGLALAGGAAQAAKFKVLHSFCGTKDGCIPQGPLVMDSAGNLFGTTARGGENEHGTAFEMVRKENGGFHEKTIFRFCQTNLCQNGANPTGALIVDAQGNLYGTTSQGGNSNHGVVFKLTPNVDRRRWSETLLYRFCTQQGCTDGKSPNGGLTYAGASSGVPYDGVSPLYGATSAGGANNGGAVFELTNNGGQWSEMVLYSFCSQGGTDCTDGAAPSGGVVLDQAGNLYGNTFLGGAYSLADGVAGVVYEVSKIGGSWSEIVLHNFCSEDSCSDGAGPLGSPVIDGAGNLLGTTAVGGRTCPLGPSGCGVIFKLVPNGEASVETVLYEFCQKQDCADGSGPLAAPTIDPAGNLFGTTVNGGGNDIDENHEGGGVVYKLTGTSYKVLYRFCSLANCADGEYPEAGLIMNSFGEALGTTNLGGANGGDIFGGTVFRVRP